MNIELHKTALAHLESKFNILLKLNVRKFDYDWTVLLENLKQIKTTNFSSNDRILICHMDTGYYDPLLPVGIITINLIRCFQLLDIPMYLLIFITNHYGISQEFNLLLADHPLQDRPTIIETLLSSRLLSENGYEQKTLLNAERIEKPGLCMVGAQRSHRVALLNFFKNNNLSNSIAISANFAKK